MYESYMCILKDIMKKHLLGLNCNKETSTSHMEKRLEILYLKTFSKEDGSVQLLSRV